jgi:hypothetical protein
MKRDTSPAVGTGDTPIFSESVPKVADEVWIVTTLLHRENPDRPDFSIEEILKRAKEEKLTDTLRPGVYVHIVQHCVANRPPNPARYRMLLETASGRRRLFRPGDSYHPAREGGKMTPSPEDIPRSYADLLTWYREWCSASVTAAPEADPLLALVGSGKDLWADEHADEYIRRLREGWQ